MRRAGVDEAAIEATLGQLSRHRLVDDDSFARYWVERRQTRRPRGARLLRAELAQRGVARGVADEATAPLEASADEDAYRAAARRRRHLRDLDEATFRARLSAFLARRGFDWETAASVVERLWAENDPDRRTQ